MKIRKFLVGALTFAVGAAAGGYVFSESQPRSFLAVYDCRDRCLRPNELAGLLVSVGVLRADEIIPGVQMESDECIAVEHPRPQARVHVVLLPKHDLRDIGAVTARGETFVLGCLAMIGELARKHDLEDFKVVTNGPGFQMATYLHFHFMADQQDHEAVGERSSGGSPRST